MPGVRRRRDSAIMTFDNAAEFWIPCPHDYSGACSRSIVLPNYHPLAADEISGLVSFAINSANVASYSHAVIRLLQGIPGMTCPYPTDGDVADIMTWVERFVADMADGDDGHYAPLAVLVKVLT